MWFSTRAIAIGLTHRRSHLRPRWPTFPPLSCSLVHKSIIYAHKASCLGLGATLSKTLMATHSGYLRGGMGTNTGMSPNARRGNTGRRLISAQTTFGFFPRPSSFLPPHTRF